MACENLKTSELDREIDRDLESSDSSNLFGDDSDADPSYNPISQPSTSTFVLNTGRPNTHNVLDSSDTDSDDYLPRPPKQAKRQQQSNLPKPNQTRPINRQVISDSSDDTLDNISDDNANLGHNVDNWHSVTEDDGIDFAHSFSFYETPGPRHCNNLDPNTSKPIKYFDLFFTTNLLSLFVTETNRYASQNISSQGNNISPYSKLKSWTPVSLLELKAFIAVLLNMGLIRKPTIKSYWSKTCSQSTPWFGKMFSRLRFESILTYFHMVDNSKLPKSTEPGYDGAQKFQPLQDHCNRVFHYYYTGHEQLSIDESLIGTKNQTSLMQYLPNKHHHRWGIKMWVLCDAVSKYCLSFFCYKGARSQEDKEEIKEQGLAYTVVTKLLKACNYLYKGYHIFTDNFFSSLHLVKMLYTKNTFLTGTIRKNRKGLPNELKEKIEPGQTIYCKKDNTVVMAYRQKKTQKNPVLLVSSKPEVKNVESTKKRRGRETTESKPAIIQNYNKYMGGIDHFDMMLYTYLDERRTIKYWKKVAFNLFARMVLNAYVIYKDKSLNDQIKPISRYQFIVSIIESISEEWFAEKQLDPRGGGNGPKGLERLPGSSVKTCWVCTKKGENYKQSRRKSRLVCSQCKEGCHSVCFGKHVCK